MVLDVGLQRSGNGVRMVPWVVGDAVEELQLAAASAGSTQCPRYVSAVLCGSSELSPGMVWIHVPRWKKLTCLSSQIGLAVRSRAWDIPLPARPAAHSFPATALALLPVVHESQASYVSRTALSAACP